MGDLRVGTLATGVLAEVASDGTVRRGDVRVGWRVLAGTRWVEPAADPTVRHGRVGAAPVAETAVRVPGGDVVQRVYALGDHGGLVVVDVENASPEAVAVAFTCTGAAPEDVCAFSRPPAATEADGARTFPVPHRTSVRVVLAAADVVGRLDVRALPDAAAAARAWEAVLDRGMRTELPEPLQTEIDAARCDLLLAPRSAAAFVGLEDWGFDREAHAMWERLGSRARRDARRRRVERGLLGEIRDALVRESAGGVDVLPGFRSEWLGAPVAVHDVPLLGGGTLAFAVRWHGPRPALLWDAPATEGVRLRLRAPLLDPAWEAATPAGETLLAEPPTGLLAMGAGGDAAPREGVHLDDPGSFS